MDKKDKAIIDILKTIRDENPDSFVYVVPNLFTRKMRSYMLIREDLRFITEIVTKLIPLKSEAEPDRAMCFALWQSVIITYGKCFTENKAGLSKLERSALNGNEGLQDLHDRIMQLRHAYVAHRGDTEHEQAVVFMKMDKTKDTGQQTEYQIKSRKLLSPGAGALGGYLELFNLLLEEVAKKIQKHSEKAHQAFFEKLSPKQISLLLINNMRDLD
jgi:hypothetical protein